MMEASPGCHDPPNRHRRLLHVPTRLPVGRGEKTTERVVLPYHHIFLKNKVPPMSATALLAVACRGQPRGGGERTAPGIHWVGGIQTWRRGAKRRKPPFDQVPQRGPFYPHCYFCCWAGHLPSDFLSASPPGQEPKARFPPRPIEQQPQRLQAERPRLQAGWWWGGMPLTAPKPESSTCLQGQRAAPWT